VIIASVTLQIGKPLFCKISILAAQGLPSNIDKVCAVSTLNHLAQNIRILPQQIAMIFPQLFIKSCNHNVYAKIAYTTSQVKSS